MDLAIKKHIEPIIENAKLQLNSGKGQILFVCPDEDILNCAADEIAKFATVSNTNKSNNKVTKARSTRKCHIGRNSNNKNSKNKITEISDFLNYTRINVINERDPSPDNKIFFIKLENKSSIMHQSLLYYYLELPMNSNCIVCLLSTSALCLNIFEKRVRSRFKNKIFFIPYLFNKDFNNKDSNTNINYVGPTVNAVKQHELLKSTNLDQFSLEFIFSLFNPLHFTIIFMAAKYKISAYDVFDHFQRFVVNINPIKKTNSISVLFAFYDLIDSQIISQSGKILIDMDELKDYVLKNCPQFIKNLARSK